MFISPQPDSYYGYIKLLVNMYHYNFHMNWTLESHYTDYIFLIIMTLALIRNTNLTSPRVSISACCGLLHLLFNMNDQDQFGACWKLNYWLLSKIFDSKTRCIIFSEVRRQSVECRLLSALNIHVFAYILPGPARVTLVFWKWFM